MKPEDLISNFNNTIFDPDGIVARAVHSDCDKAFAYLPPDHETRPEIAQFYGIEVRKDSSVPSGEIWLKTKQGRIVKRLKIS